MMTVLHPLETLILFALFAEIKVGTDGTFEADAADTPSAAVAGDAIAVDVVVDEVVTGVEIAVDGGRDVVVDCGKGVVGVDFGLGFDADAAEVKVLAFQAFMADADNVLRENGQHLVLFGEVSGNCTFLHSSQEARCFKPLPGPRRSKTSL
jgi:hypothetical protein